MISPGSLAAFSASVASSLPSARTGAVPGLLPIRDAQPAKPVSKVPTGLPLPPGNQRLPRGSLLDLQV